MRKKKDNGLKAVIALAVATVVVGGASIAISSMENAGSVTLDVAGANTKIKEARQNADGTYTVLVSEQGYVGEMLIEATYSADGQTLVSYDVISHTETEGYGSKVDEAAYKALLEGVTLPIAASGMDKTVSGILGLAAGQGNAQDMELKDGEYSAQTEADDNGEYAVVTVTVEGGKITAATWDEITGGVSKAELSRAGKYDMKPVWAAQAESLGKYVVENQGTAGLVNEKGGTDAVSGVSIYIGGFAALVDQAVAKADGADGVYEAKTEPDDKGDYGIVTVTVEGGKIANVVWDEITGGVSKAQLSKEGKYPMKPIWATQAEAMCSYVVENQGTVGLNLNEQGKTDAVSGVSVSVGGFAALIEEVLQQASVNGVLPTAAALEAVKVDVVSGATFSSQAVIRAVDEGFVYLRDFVINK